MIATLMILAALVGMLLSAVFLLKRENSFLLRQRNEAWDQVALLKAGIAPEPREKGNRAQMSYSVDQDGTVVFQDGSRYSQSGERIE